MIGEKDYSMVYTDDYPTVPLKYSRWNVKRFGQGYGGAKAVYVVTI